MIFRITYKNANVEETVTIQDFNEERLRKLISDFEILTIIVFSSYAMTKQDTVQAESEHNENAENDLKLQDYQIAKVEQESSDFQLDLIRTPKVESVLEERKEIQKSVNINPKENSDVAELVRNPETKRNSSPEVPKAREEPAKKAKIPRRSNTKTYSNRGGKRSDNNSIRNADVVYFFSKNLSKEQSNIVESAFDSKKLTTLRTIATSSKNRFDKIADILSLIDFTDNQSYFSAVCYAICEYKIGDDLNSVAEKVQDQLYWLKPSKISFFIVFGIKGFLKENSWAVSAIDFIHIINCLLEKEAYK